MVHSVWGLILACGKSEEFDTGASIPFLNISGKPILAYSLMAYERCPDIDGIIVVTDKAHAEHVVGITRMFGCSKVKKVVTGATQRNASIIKGLEQLDEKTTVVSIHEATRICIASEQISDTIKAAKRYGCATVAELVRDTVKYVEKGSAVKKSLESGKLWAVGTPQTFKKDILMKAIASAQKKKVAYMEETELIGGAKNEVRLVSVNDVFKIRTPDDLALANVLVSQ